MVSIIAATLLIALNRSVASPAFEVPVRAPSTPSCLNSRSNADSSIGSSVAPSEITTPPRRDPPRAAATAVPPGPTPPPRRPAPRRGRRRLPCRPRPWPRPPARRERLERLGYVGGGAV